MRFIICAALTFQLLSLEAYALPTPDALLGIANTIPLLTGAVIAALSAIYYSLGKKLGPQARQHILGWIFGLFVMLIGGLTYLGYSWNETSRAKRISDIAMYLRCDMGAHEAYSKRNKSNNTFSEYKWQQFGNFQPISLEEIPRKLMAQPNAELISTSRSSIRYHSGFLAVEIDEQLHPFEYSRLNELPERLLNSNVKDLYLAQFSPWHHPPELYEHDKSIFKKFENIYIVISPPTEEQKGSYFVTDKTVGFRPVKIENKLITWPVRNEMWLLDEKRINFPGITNLLPDDDVADLLTQDDVYIVAPYSSWRRSPGVQMNFYLKKLLMGVSPDRIIPIDLGDSSTSELLGLLAEKLDGARFVVVGLTKYDWVYDGLDLAFQMWERFNHDTTRFKLEGFTTRLPEVVAITWEADNTQDFNDILRSYFWDAVTWLNVHKGINASTSIFAIAIILRLIFSPIGYLEGRSRMARAQIQRALKAEVRPIWGGSSHALLSHLKVHNGWELLGTLLTLILILPAYQILSEPPEIYANIGFLWIERLSQPDIFLSLVAGGFVYLKMLLGKSSAKSRTLIIASLLFTFLLLFLPSSLLLYVVGVLFVTTIQDAFA